MNSILKFYLMKSEYSFTSSMSVDEVIRVLGEKTDLNPDMPREKTEREKYLFFANDRLNPSLKEIRPNMHNYGYRCGPLTPIYTMELTSTGNPGETVVNVKSSSDRKMFPLWIAIEVVAVLFALICLAVFCTAQDFRFLYSFIILLVWVHFFIFLGFWNPNRFVLDDLKELLRLS